LGSQLAGVDDEVSVVGDPHAAAGGGDDLVAVEGEDARLAEGARSAALVGSAQGLSGILDDKNGVAVADCQNGRQIRAPSARSLFTVFTPAPIQTCQSQPVEECEPTRLGLFHRCADLECRACVLP